MDPCDALYKATHTPHSTIIFGNLGINSQLVEYYLSTWLKHCGEYKDENDNWFVSLVDGLSTFVIVEPEFESTIPDHRYRIIVLTSHLDFQWNCSTTHILMSHVGNVSSPQNKLCTSPIRDPQLAYIVLLRFGKKTLCRLSKTLLRKLSQHLKRSHSRLPKNELNQISNFVLHHYYFHPPPSDW